LSSSSRSGNRATQPLSYFSSK